MNLRFSIFDFRLSSRRSTIARSSSAFQIANRKSKIENGFTLTEILVVIVIIILLLALAVPAFNLIRGSRSIEGAENQVAALLGRARADAIGLQKPFGIMFFVPDPFGDARVSVAEVYAADYPDSGSPTRDVYLDLAPDTEFLQLPPGVVPFVLNNGTVDLSNPQQPRRTSDGYLGFNFDISGPSGTPPATQTGKAPGGVILFGADGQLISRTWGYRTGSSSGSVSPAAGNTTPTRMCNLIIGFNSKQGYVDAGPAVNADVAPRTALGFVLVDKETFFSRFGGGGPQALADPQFGAAGGNYVNSSEPVEEDWIDKNGAPMLVNRYNGTLVRGE